MATGGVQPNQFVTRQMAENAVRTHRGLFITASVIFLVIGIAAMALPFLAALAIDLMIGGALVISGLGQVCYSLGSRRWPGMLMPILGAVVALVVGLFLLAKPYHGVEALNIMLIFFFIFDGVAKLMYAFSSRDIPSWPWLVTSGLLSLILGAMVWMYFDKGQLWVVGLLFGVNFTITGFSMLLFASAIPKGAAPQTIDATPKSEDETQLDEGE